MELMGAIGQTRAHPWHGDSPRLSPSHAYIILEKFLPHNLEICRADITELAGPTGRLSKSQLCVSLTSDLLLMGNRLP